MIDLIIVLSYFFLIFFIAVSKGYNKNLSAEEYFLSSRKLKWPSIALSTIATNVNGYQFLGMMGSAYLYGLAQANLEINAIQGLLIAAFIFSGYPHHQEAKYFAKLVLPRLKTISLPEVRNRIPKETPKTPLGDGPRF